MKTINGINNSNIIKGLTGVGLGNFDGLHVGHMHLINTLINECRLNNLDSVIYTFIKHPENILRKKLFTPLLTNINKKIELLEKSELDYLCFDEFDENYSRMKPEAFVKEILVDKLHMKLAVSGFNYRFGYKGEGDGELLKELGNKYDFKTIIIPPIKINNEVVSSTLIRQNVAKGNMEKVFGLLGRHYSITGIVENGKRIGSKMGFPTANIHPEEYLLMPSEGVYVTKTLYDGALYNSVTNIGKNPTFNGEHTTVETHILDFEGYIYGKSIEVFFFTKLRSEKKFKDKDELVLQLQKDILMTKQFFSTNS